ncbi:MAG TPA: serine/threonine-protein kinase [Haliangiales bacterium]|nr:serine/threonine-protein kinase [Haliangiales bacterium]
MSGPVDSDDAPTTLADTEADPGRAGRPKSTPSHLGEFAILGVIGSGGMGVVYAARDPALDRKVAIKVLRHGEVGSDTRRARLLREARAMARLRHPNVVTVHEVGEHDGKVFVVMELVEGATLRDWLREPRPWRAVVERLCQAGRGLAAAHRAGLVHRDFKPENVFVGSDGRVRVGDFGVVGVSRDAADATGSPEEDATLTAAGAVVGTPRYMSPEQHRAGDVDARADQFAFAAVLYEALYGVPPFPGKTMAELRRNVLAGNVEPAPGNRAPRWLEPIVRRGLRADPAARYPSLEPMLDALERGPLLTGRRLAIAAGAIALVGVAAWSFVRSQSDPCRDLAARLAGAWDPAVKAEVAKAFAASGRPYGADTSRRAGDVLDVYAGEWVAARTEACRANAGVRVACLDGRLGALRAQTRLFAAADGDVVDKAVQAALALEPIEGCSLAQGRPRARTPEGIALQQRLDDAGAQVRAGKIAAAQATVGALVDDARRVGDKVLLAETLLHAGRVKEEKEAAAAAAALEEAAAVAGDQENDQLVAAALVRLLRVVGKVQKRYAEARALRPAVEAAVRRTKDDRFVIELMLLTAEMAQQEGAHARALELGEEAVALAEKKFGAGSLEALRAAGARVAMLDETGDYERAAREEERLLAMKEKLLGPDNADLASNLNLLGVEEWRLNRYDAAQAHFERALRIIEATAGTDSLRAASVQANLGLLAMDHRDAERALDRLGRALAIQEKVLGPENVTVAGTLNSIGNVHLNSKRFDDALAYHRRALAIREKLLSPTHADVAFSTQNIGMTMLDMGKPRDAIPWFERTLGIVERTLPRGHRRTMMTMTALSDAYVDVGRSGDALALLDRAEKLLEEKPDPLARAHLDFCLARALRAARRDPDRALRLARAARDKLAGEGVQERGYVERIDRFLAEK